MNYDKIWIDEMIVTFDSISAFKQTAPPVCVPTPAMPCMTKSVKKKVCPEWFEGPQEKQETENTMNTNSERDYLARRLENVNYGKDFGKIFNLNSQSTPSTYKELIDWIQNGKFTIDAKRSKLIDAQVEDQGAWYGSAFDGITFTANPQPDLAGYEQAKKDARKQYQNAKDVIMTGDAAAGLKTLQDFEAWMPTPTTVGN